MSETTAPVELIEITGSRLVRDDFVLGRTTLDRTLLNNRLPSGLVEALNLEAGIYVNQPGGGGSIASLHLRGAEPNYTLVLIDGIAITDTTDSRGGSFDLAGIDPSTIERIDIIQGAGLTLYGPGALGGVINIHTRGPQEELTARARVETDLDGYSRANGGAGLILGDNITLQSDVAYVDTGRLSAGSRAESIQSVSKLRFKMGEQIDSQLYFRISDTQEEAFPDDSGGVEHAIFRELDHRDIRQYQAAFLNSWDGGGAWKARTSFSWFRQERQESSPGIFPGTFIPPNGADTTLERFSWRGDASWSRSSNFSVLLGGSYEHEKGQSQGYLFALGVFDLPYTLVRETVGGFVETLFKVGPQTKIHSAARIDDVSAFGTHGSFSASLTHELSSEVQLRLGGATGFKPPSFFAVSHPLTGNPNLKVEKARTSEFSIEYQPDMGNLSIVGSLFHNRFRNQVDFDETTFSHVNRDRLTIAGGELRLNWRPVQNLALAANATYMDINIHGLDRPPRNRPDFLFGASASYSPTDKLTLTVNAQARSEQFASSFVTGPTFLEGYEQLDMVLLWKPADHIEISGRLLNVLGNDYEEAVGFPNPGRRFLLGIGFTL